MTSWVPSPRRAFRVWQRNASVYRRTWKTNILPNFFEPLLYLLAIGVGLGAFVGRQIEGLRYASYLAPALAAVSATMGASFEVTWNAYVRIHMDKIWEAATSTPVMLQDVVLGELAWSASRGTIYGTAFLVVAALLGYVDTPLAILAVPAFALLAFVFALLGMTFTALVPTIDFYSFYFTLFVTPLTLFSGVYFPLERMPGWLQGVAWFSPLRHSSCLLRVLFLGHRVGATCAAAPLEALWLAGAAVLLFPLPALLLRRRLIR
ncbi:MAG: ABC transporter permease [Actinomycetota bacterium]